MDAVRWEERPQLRRPVLIAAFEGWNDAGDAASTAARYLATEWGGRRIASIDPEEFYDFTVVRPTVRLVDGLTREIDWPDNEFAVGVTPARDILFLHGIEPQLKWRTFTDQVVNVAKALNVELALTLGALLAEVPHTRPVHVTGTAGSDDMAKQFGLERSQYEGPTGIVGVLHDALAQAGISSASLWAAVPAYVAKTPSPKGALALVRRTADLLQERADVTSLEIASAAYERQVSEVVNEDEDVASYVRGLEESDDAERPSAEASRGHPSGQEPMPPMVGGDALAAEVERFLREHGDS
ncbi:MAG TPA: PAC2 family protein [Acidimicrobiales bacterium]|jgi:predicted ATP-grasp superfamily ATP-dependent carboligase|nr:PAC2 family protein [Acidimicrobiales bacterium]